MVALGLAVPARADDAPSPSPTVPSAVTAVATPTAPDTSQAAAAVDVAAAQVGAANLDVSVRIGSPGDNGAVAQTIAAQADAAQTAVQSSDIAQAGATQTDATQVAPANVAVSIRIASPGSDGTVTQATTADSSAQTQYQPPAAQYQPDPAPEPAAQAPEAPAVQPATATPQPSATTSPSSVPSTWTWNWTWTCGDTTGSDTTHAIDTGFQGWIWTWNLDTICATPSAPATPAAPITPPQSPTVISPVVPAPALPVPPTLAEPAPPQLPEVVPPVPPIGPVQPELVAPVVVPPAMPALTQLQGSGALLPPRRFELRRSGARPRPPLPWLTADVSTPSAPHEAAPVRGRIQPAPQPRAKGTAPLHLLAFPTLPATGGAAGGGGGGGSGVVAALAVWMLLQLPGLSVLRLPPSRRSPRARVDDIRNRPG